MRGFKRFTFVLLLALAGNLAFMPGANAQDAATTEETATQEKPAAADVGASPKRIVLSEETKKKIGFKIENYVDPSYENLAHLYWNLGMLDINNNQHVDNFLLITECEMYQNYITNDLEWAEIRESSRDFLKKNYKYFPTHFKISIPLYLGRYDSDREIFDVNMEKSAIDAARKIETIYFTKMVVCGKAGEIEGYPKNLILLLNRPFSLPFVPVEKELARLFLDEANYNNYRRSMAAAVREDAHERLAVLELMIRVHSYKEVMPTVGGALKTAVFAQIDYIRVFADFEKEKLLFEKDMFTEQQRRLRRKGEDEEPGHAMDLPEGPIFGTVIEEGEEQ